MLEQIETLLAEGLTFRQIGNKLGVTRATVAGMVARHIRCGRREPRPPAKVREPNPDGLGASWTEAKLTEPWAQYHARKQAERAARKQAA